MGKKKDRSNIIVGTVLICLGLLFLLNTFNLISWQTWNLIIHFWPVIFIIIGLNILFKRSKLWWLVPLLIIILFLALIFASSLDMQPFKHHFSDEEYSGNYSYSRDLKKDLEELQVDINYKAGELILTEADNEKLCTANLKYYNLKPDIKYKFQETTSRGHLLIEQQEKVKINKLTDGSLWEVDLTRHVPLFINMNTGAGKIDLDISELKVAQLNVNSGVSDLKIRYNNYDTKSVIKSGASNIKLYIPSQTAIKITTSAVINNNNFEDAGLIKLSNKLYQSKNIGKANHRVSLNISTSASNIDLVYR